VRMARLHLVFHGLKTVKQKINHLNI
jgi:hypothetical protein